MFKKITNFLKKVVFSFLLLYSYNFVMQPLNFVIPINMVTVLFLSILGFPALLGFIVILFVLY